MIRGIFGKIFSKWVLIPLVLAGVFFGFAYWRGYSPMETVGKIPVIGPMVPRATVSKTETAEEVETEIPATKAENPLSKAVKVGSQALGVTRPARSQVWDVFEYEVGFGDFKHPIWVWIVTVLSAATVVIPVVSWGVKRIVSKTGITIHRPEDPKTFAIQAVGVLAIGVALLEVFRRYGALAGLGVAAAGVAEFLVITKGWQELPNSVRKIGKTPLSDFLEIIVGIVMFIVRFALLLSATAIPLMTAGSFLAPGKVTITRMQAFTTDFANAVPSPVDVVTDKFVGAFRFAITTLDMLSLGYNPIALVALTGLLTILLIGAGGHSEARGTQWRGQR